MKTTTKKPKPRKVTEKLSYFISGNIDHLFGLEQEDGSQAEYRDNHDGTYTFKSHGVPGNFWEVVEERLITKEEFEKAINEINGSLHILTHIEDGIEAFFELEGIKNRQRYGKKK
jgi:hypothetical protein